MSLPLPSARLKRDPCAPWDVAVWEVLQEEGLTLPELKIKGMQKQFFSRGDRPGCVRPGGLEYAGAADDRHPGRKKLVLKFDLPRGSYATMLVKRVS